jgi:hypothetical protein
MARIRSIKPQAFTSESLATRSVAARWTFAGLWTYCDDDGYGKADPRLIKGQLWPLDDDVMPADVAGYLGELERDDDPLICRYVVDGREYLHVLSWEHQSIQKKTKSKLPACPIHCSSAPPPDPYAETPVDLQESYVSDAGEAPETYRGEQGKGFVEQGREEESPSPEPAALVLVTADAVTARPKRPSFDDFWAPYPRKVGKDDARKAWDKATKIRKVDPGVIVAGAKRFAADPNLPAKQFIPHPSTWLARGGWQDEPCPATGTTGRFTNPGIPEGW